MSARRRLLMAVHSPKPAVVRALFRFHGALADTVVAISAWIAEAFAGARASVLLNRVGIPIPERPARAHREPGLARGPAANGRLRVEQHFDEARSHGRLREEVERLVAARRDGRSVAADPALFAQ